MTKEDKLKLCVGCRDDFYNGKNDLGVRECWTLETAQPVQRTLVGTFQEPPYQWDPVETLSCHSTQGKSWIKEDDCRIDKEKTPAKAEG